MKTKAPLWLGSCVAVVVAFEYFIKGATLRQLSSFLQNSTIVMSACAMALGAVGMIQRNVRMVSRRSSGWVYSMVVLLSMCVFPIIRAVSGTRSPAFLFVYNNYFAPVGATLFAFLIFYTGTAVYRTFNVRNAKAFVLLASGVLLMLGRMPLGDAIWEGFPVIGNWIMQVPNSAANRGIIISSGIGVVASGVRYVLGLERTRL